MLFSEQFLYSLLLKPEKYGSALKKKLKQKTSTWPNLVKYVEQNHCSDNSPDTLTNTHQDSLTLTNRITRTLSIITGKATYSFIR